MTNLIPLSYLNEACDASVNVNAKRYQMVLKLAQIELKGILGGEFYAEIESQYPSSFSTDNATLYEDYIKDYLAWQTYFQYLKFAQFDSTATGIRQFKDENSEIVGDVKMYAFEKNVSETSNKYRELMIGFLILSQSNDSTKYPKWKNTFKATMGFGFSIIARGNADQVISVNKTATRNE